jgi:hypothetical protein
MGCRFEACSVVCGGPNVSQLSPLIALRWVSDCEDAIAMRVMYRTYGALFLLHASQR